MEVQPIDAEVEQRTRELRVGVGAGVNGGGAEDQGAARGGGCRVEWRWREGTGQRRAPPPSRQAGRQPPPSYLAQGLESAVVHISPDVKAEEVEVSQAREAVQCLEDEGGTGRT